MPIDVSQVDIIFFPDPELTGTQEYVLGVSELKKRLPSTCKWYEQTHAEHPPSECLKLYGKSPWVLLVLTSSVLICDHLVEELLSVAKESGRTCVLPEDPRGLSGNLPPDYTTRPGFDRFVRQLTQRERWRKHDGRTPWIMLARRDDASELLEKRIPLIELPFRTASPPLIAMHAFVHSYADYFHHDRAEMLRLLPSDVQSLLDVGGGLGNFAFSFLKKRSGRAVLVEPVPKVTEVARKRGLSVIQGDFLSVSIDEKFDCVSFLDVLEHLPDPALALRKARACLNPGGYLLLSVPNIGHWSIVRDLLEGQFDYQPAGILCVTHLRFFTCSSLRTLIEDTGFRIMRWENVHSPPNNNFLLLLNNAAKAGIKPDLTNLSTESFHVLAVCD